MFLVVLFKLCIFVMNGNNFFFLLNFILNKLFWRLEINRVRILMYFKYDVLLLCFLINFEIYIMYDI